MNFIKLVFLLSVLFYLSSCDKNTVTEHVLENNTTGTITYSVTASDNLDGINTDFITGTIDPGDSEKIFTWEDFITVEEAVSGEYFYPFENFTITNEADRSYTKDLSTGVNWVGTREGDFKAEQRLVITDDDF